MRTIIQLSILSSTLERLDAWVAARALPGRGVAIGTLLDIAEEGRDRPGEPCPAPGCRLDAGHEGDHRRGRWLKSLRGRSDNEAPSRNRQSSTETGGESPVNESSQVSKCLKTMACVLSGPHVGPCWTFVAVNADRNSVRLSCGRPSGHTGACFEIFTLPHLEPNDVTAGLCEKLGRWTVNESSQPTQTQQFQAVGTCTKFLNCLLGDGHDGPCFTKDGVDAPCPTLGCLKPAGHRSLCMVDSSPAGSPAPIVNESSRDSPDIPDDQVRAGDMLKVTDEGLLAKAIGSQGDNAIVPVARAFDPAASSAAAEAADKLLSAPHRVSEESWSTYQRLLNQLCVRFGLAGSPSWDEALNQLAAKLVWPPHEALQRWLCEERDVNDPCQVCHGTGVRTYPNTATWRRGGLSGQQITSDVCDRCWGSGDEHRHGADLRKLHGHARSMELKLKALEARIAAANEAEAGETGAAIDLNNEALKLEAEAAKEEL